MPALRTALLLLLSLLACIGCNRAPIEIDQPRFNAEIERRASLVLAKPEVEKRFDALVNGMFDDPAVSQAGQGLMSSVGADPTLKPGFDAVLTRLGSQPVMKQLALRLMRENPGASPEKIGELAEKRMSGVTDGAVFERAFSRAFNDLLARRDVSAVFHRLSERIGTNGPMTSALSEGVIKRVSEERVRKRLLELNGGKTPDRARATELLLDATFSDERVAGFYRDLTSLPVVKRELAAAARDIAKAPAFQRYAIEAARTCVDDEAFRDRAVDAMSVLLSEGITEDQLTAALKRLLETPAVPRALVTMMDRMLADPSLGEIGSRSLGQIAGDPAFQAAIVKLYDGF